jgi:hypothetical protein
LFGVAGVSALRLSCVAGIGLVTLEPSLTAGFIGVLLQADKTNARAAIFHILLIMFFP